MLIFALATYSMFALIIVLFTTSADEAIVFAVIGAGLYRWFWFELNAALRRGQ